MNETEPRPCTLKDVAELALKAWRSYDGEETVTQTKSFFNAGSRTAYARILTKITNEHTLAGWIREVEANGGPRMNWYVKYEGTGEIVGPMSYERAEHCSQAADGMVFSEAIFDQEEVEEILSIPSEVESLISDLGSIHGRRNAAWSPEEDELGSLLKMAIDTIVLLSRMPTSVVVRELTDELQNLREAMQVIRNGEDDAIGVMLGQAIDLIANLSAKKVVTGTIQGGVLTLDDVPDGVEVDIRDYDCEGGDEENLDEDETGTHFQAG